MADKCLILTSTIDPGGMIYTERHDIRLRIQDYANSFEYWVNNDFFQKIIYCDNSDHPLTFIHDIVRRSGTSKNIEILSYNGNFNKTLGKGYGEVEILEHIYENSRIINPDDLIYKLSGRYIVRNITDFHFEELTENSIVCNMNYYRNWTDSRFFITRYHFIPKYLFPLKNHINDVIDQNLENVLAQSISHSVNDGFMLDIFKTCPVIEGISGGYDKNLPSNFWYFLMCQANQRVKLKYFKLRGLIQ